MSRVVVPSEIEELATQAVDAALVVHREFGPGLLESAYRDCMVLELTLRGMAVERELNLPITFRGHTLPNAYRVDLLINKTFLIELKAVESLHPIHRVQLNTYLKLLRLPLGLLINFNVPLIKDGTHRILNLDFQSQT
jgi:GxxExxY protein